MSILLKQQRGQSQLARAVGAVVRGQRQLARAVGAVVRGHRQLDRAVGAGLISPPF